MKAIERYCKNCKKHYSKNSKKQILASANFFDFDEASQHHIREQVQQANTNCETTDAMSVGLSVTFPSVQPQK